MARRLQGTFTTIVIGTLAAVPIALMAQSALGQVGLTEADAQEFVLEHVSSGRLGTYIVDPYLTAYQKLPASARGSVTTALYAWTKAYVGSPAFRKAYATRRANNTPEEKKHEGTVDQEVKKKIDQMRADEETSYKQMVAAGMKAQADQAKKAADEMLPAMMPALRQAIEEERAKDKAEYEVTLKFWQDYYPADPMVLVARHLREYIANTADVDFTAKQEKRMGGVGEYTAFVNEAYNEKPWQWRLSYGYGPEVTAAGRAAAAAWLKEMGPK